MKKGVKRFLAGLCTTMMLSQTVLDSGFVLYAAAGEETVVETDAPGDEAVSEDAVSVDSADEEAVSEDAVSVDAADEEAVSEDAVSEEPVEVEQTEDSVDAPDPQDDNAKQYLNGGRLILDGNKLYSKTEAYLGIYDSAKGELVIDKDVATVPGYTFVGWKDLQSVKFASGSKAKNIGQPTGDESGAFQECENLKSVDMSNATDLTTIKFNSFANCVSLNTVIFNEGLNQIEKYAFAGCKALEEVTFEKELRSIGERAFADCTSLHKIILKGTATSCETGGTFNGCAIDSFTLAKDGDGIAVFPSRLFENATFKEGAKITIDKDVVQIGEYAFSGSNIAHVVLPGAKLTSIDQDAFSSCESLQEIDFSACTGLHYIRENAFSGCKSLKSLVLPDNITTVEDNAFRDCEGIQTLILSKGMQRKDNLGSGIFENCKSLQRVEFSAEHKYVAKRMFCGCEQLAEVDFSASNIVEIDDQAFMGCTYIDPMTGMIIGGLEVAELPETLTKLGESAFAECRVLKLVTFPSRKAGVSDEDQFHEIPNGCFAYCGVLKKADLREGITKIGDEAFLYCNAYSSTLPDTLEYIGHDAFNTCSFHGDLILPAKLNYIGAGAFKGCEDLYGADSQYEKINKVIIKPRDIEYCGEEIFKDCYISDFELAEGVTRVPANLFNRTTWKTGKVVVIPNTVVEIGNGAFAGEEGNNVGNIKELVFEEGSRLEIIGEDAFRYNSTVEAINLPVKVKVLGAHSFASCTKLKSIIIPESVTEMGEGVFENCSLLETVEFNAIAIEKDESGNDKCGRNIFYGCNLKTIAIGEKVTVFPDHLFEGAQFQESEAGKYVPIKLVLPASVTRIGDYSLTNVVNLESLSFKDGSKLEEIGQYALYGCKGLKTVSLPNSLKEIGQSAFEDCKILTGIKLPASLEVMGEKVFKNCALITEANIPVAIARVEAETFAGCTKLAKVVFDGSNVETIASQAFSECSALKSINIPESVKNIDNSAFEKCTGIVSANFAASGNLESIGDEAFSASPIGGVLDLPEAVRYIYGRAFYETGKNKVTDVYLYEFVEYMGEEVFNVKYKDNLRFHVTTDSPAENWLKENGFVDSIVESTPKGETFTITFDLMEHGENFERKVKEGTKLPKPADPTDPEYEFGGWFTDKTCKKEYNFDDLVTKEFTLYAKWAKKAVNIEGGDSALDPVPEITADTTELWLVKGQKFNIGEGWAPADKNSKKYVSVSKKGAFKAKKITTDDSIKIHHDGREDITIHISQPSLAQKKLTFIYNTADPLPTQSIMLVKDEHLKNVVWYSSAPDVATVNDKGEVTAVGKGSAKISAYINGTAYNCSVKVNEKVAAKERTIHMTLGGKAKTINLKKVKAVWTSSDTEVAEIIGKGNKISVKKAGTAEITATAGGVDYKINLIVEDITLTGGESLGGGAKNKYTLSLAKGASADLAFTSLDPERVVVFKSSKPDVAYIDENGHVVARGTGSTKFTTKINGTAITVDVTVQ